MPFCVKKNKKNERVGEIQAPILVIPLSEDDKPRTEDLIQLASLANQEAVSEHPDFVGLTWSFTLPVIRARRTGHEESDPLLQ